MSQNHINYMSGVPVKIAENYKPPKKIAINQNVAQRIANSSNITQQLLANNTYDFHWEKTVLAKMSEWQHVCQREIGDRKERMRLQQQELQKQLEKKQKQMLTAVSYPSTDDLSSDDGDDGSHGTSSDASKSALSLKKLAAVTTSVPISASLASKTPASQQFSPQNHFDNILVPTVMPERFYQQNNAGAMKTQKYTKINFSEFENDTSSPFDNVELKTINDLDILAEVLNTSVAVSRSDRSTSKEFPDNTGNVIGDSSVQTIEQQQQQQIKQMNLQNQKFFYQQQTGKLQLAPKITTMKSNSPIPKINGYYFYQMTPDRQVDKNSYNGNGIETTTMWPKQNAKFFHNSTINDNPYAGVQNQYTPNNYIKSNYINVSGQSMVSNTDFNTGATITSSTVIATTNIQSSVKSKSKSVPDIVQEIKVELKAADKKRVRNNSQSSINTMKDERCIPSTSTNKHAFQSLAPVSNISMYRQLSISSQKLANNISLMGFPLEQVARIIQKLGTDDKKIIEHLIPLSELLDLGFDENKTSDALLQFDNNKEKALDLLIS